MMYPRRFGSFAFFAALAACASVPAPPAPGTATVALGQAAQVGSLGMRPLAVSEDSRCPASVQCIWAGRLRLRILIDDPAAMSRPGGPQAPTTAVAEETNLDLGVPKSVLGRRVTLIDATPGPIAGQAIPPTAYRFTLRVEERP
jgi:hypothetical protein